MAAGLMLALALPAAALPVSFSGTYADNTNPENAGDLFTITNDGGGASLSNITQVQIDLGGVSALFDPADSAFTVTLGSDVTTGFDGNFNLVGSVLTLNFNLAGLFEPGETFSFTVDTDDTVAPTNRVEAVNIGGAPVTAFFAIDPGTPLATTMVAGAPGSRSATWSVNGDITPVPEPANLPLVGFGLIALAWARRRARRS
ncbi:MAG: PEP-CTERM sorting domain-containing protein [Myxococcales bacterium]|nr:PEP-CTERM sorting domain-containing protein [Myxococcales bacterium]MDH5307283.1 PEP-CTERM sorting domain-containing protein [Myxococcales bacterium]MDH5566764.1 PEP-CTERM sorting domain-containing protein [Myxococcales bacterium]